jgi:large subunit ribosomal protein L21
MYAIIETGGKQHRVKAGDKLRIDLMNEVKKGEKIVFDKILMLGSDTYQIGKPYVANAKVTATVTHMGPDGLGVKDTKILVFKKKRRQGYTKMRGHRQRYTEILVDSVEA